LPNNPEGREKPNSDSVTIVKTLVLSATSCLEAASVDEELLELLKRSQKKEISMAAPEERPILFMRGMAGACAVAIRDYHIRGQHLVDLYAKCNEDLSDLAGVLLAMNVGTPGGKAARRIGQYEDSRNVEKLNVRATVDDLIEKYGDFSFYHGALKKMNAELRNIIHTEAEAVPPQREGSVRKPSSSDGPQ